MLVGVLGIDAILVAGKEYLPAIPLFTKCDEEFNELSRTGGRGRRSCSALTAGVGLPNEYINILHFYLLILPSKMYLVVYHSIESLCIHIDYSNLQCKYIGHSFDFDNFSMLISIVETIFSLYNHDEL